MLQGRTTVLMKTYEDVRKKKLLKSQEKWYEIIFIHLQPLYPGQGNTASGSYLGNTGRENILKLLTETN